MQMKDKLHNILSDPNITFWLVSTPELKRLIVENTHPYIVGLSKTAKANYLADLATPIDRIDIEAFVRGELNEKYAFLLSTGEVRVGGAANIILKENQIVE